MSNVVGVTDLETWQAGFEDLFDQVGRRFGRVETRLQARAYLRGLLAPVECKNCGSWRRRQGSAHRTGCNACCADQTHSDLGSLAP